MDHERATELRDEPGEQSEFRGKPEDVDFFKLMKKHMPRTFIAVMRRLPADPRCRLCRAPYGGIGGRIMRRVGFGPSRKNPSLCNTCFERAPMGGVEMEIGVLFADVRRFTAMASEMSPTEVAELMNRFYGCAATVLGRVAVIDKLVGDEVMALYIPALIGEGWEDEMLRDAKDLLGAAGFGSDQEPWLNLGLGLDLGDAFVGNVGSGEVKDFTALGDVVNTAARLQSVAGAGQIAMSERVFRRLSSREDCVPRQFTLRGKNEPDASYVVDLTHVPIRSG